MEIKIENGRVSFDMVELLESLDNEQKKDVVQYFAWNDPTWEEIKRIVAEDYAAKNYNSKVYELRLAFLRSDHVKENIACVVESLLEEIGHVENRNRAFQKIIWGWESWWREKYEYESYPIKSDWPELHFLNTSKAIEFLKLNGVIEINLEEPEKILIN